MARHGSRRAAANFGQMCDSLVCCGPCTLSYKRLPYTGLYLNTCHRPLGKFSSGGELGLHNGGSLGLTCVLAQCSDAAWSYRHSLTVVAPQLQAASVQPESQQVIVLSCVNSSISHVCLCLEVPLPAHTHIPLSVN